MAKTKAMVLTPQTLVCQICQEQVPLRRETAHLLWHIHQQQLEVSKLLVAIEANTRAKK